MKYRYYCCYFISIVVKVWKVPVNTPSKNINIITHNIFKFIVFINNIIKNIPYFIAKAAKITDPNTELSTCASGNHIENGNEGVFINTAIININKNNTFISIENKTTGLLYR